MKKKLLYIAFITLVLLLFTIFGPSEVKAEQTWRFADEGNNWQSLSDSPESELAADVANLKQLVSDGEVEQLEAAIESFKKSYPTISGEDFDAYMEGERFFAVTDWTKAVRAYDDFLNRYPQSNFYDAAIERDLSIATAYLNGEKRRALWVLRLSGFDDGVKIARNVADRLGNTDTALRALIEVANAYSTKKKYIEAYETWTDISSKWATGEIGRQALIERAYMQHSAYKGENYDSTGLTSALSFYEQYESIHPDSARLLDIDQKVGYAYEQLAHKELNIAEYYNRTDKREAAEMYYKSVIEQWPDSNAAKAARARLNNEDVTIVKADNPNIKIHVPQGVKDFGEDMFDNGNKFLDKWPDIESQLDKHLLKEDVR